MDKNTSAPCQSTAQLSEGLKNLAAAKFVTLDSADVSHPVFGEIFASFNKLSTMLQETFDFSKALSQGNISVNPPPRQNYLSMGLKSIHSQLMHIIWQAEQIAAGDYSQQIDFMGDFGKTFNWAVESLRKRREEDELNRAMLLNLFNSLQSAVVLIDDETNSVVFRNLAAEEICRGHTDLEHERRDGLMAFLYKLCKNPPPPDGKLYFEVRSKRWHKITVAETLWGEGKRVKVFNCVDVTAEQEKYQQMKDAAADALTGLDSRNLGLPKIEGMLQRLPEGAFLCVAFFDLDGLKRVNDTPGLGHTAGDDMIMRFADALKKTFRTADVLIRMGGDEFIAAFVVREEWRIGEILARFSSNVESVNVGRDIRVEYSFGWSASSLANPMTVAGMIELADARMYEHKKTRKAAKGLSVNDR
ncbi:MAG: diguanylate cyclase [Firmicutes bacterium]|nr:diguanylate cyclase [Bacillota bacterium]